MPSTAPIPYPAQDFTPGQKALAQDMTNMSYAINRVDRTYSVPLSATLTIGSDSPSGENAAVPTNGTTSATAPISPGGTEPPGSIFYVSGWNFSSRGSDTGMVNLSSGTTNRITIPPGGAGFYQMSFTATLAAATGSGPLSLLVYAFHSSGNHYDEGGASLVFSTSSFAQRGSAQFSRPLSDGDFVQAWISNNSGASKTLSRMRLSVSRMSL